MKKILLLLFIATIFLACGKDYKTPADISDKVAWLDGKSALPQFPFGTNPIYIMIHSPDCQYTQEMLDNVFARPEIIKYMNEHFTCISVVPQDIDSVRFLGEWVTGRRLIDAFRVEGSPSHYFFTPQGYLKQAHTGYIELPVFKMLLKYVAEGYWEKYDLPTFMTMPESRLDTVWGKF